MVNVLSLIYLQMNDVLCERGVPRGCGAAARARTYKHCARRVGDASLCIINSSQQMVVLSNGTHR